MNGIIGSRRTVVGISAWMSVSMAFKRFEDGGAFGSIIFAIWSLSVVTVTETMEETLFKRSMSLVTMSDFVIIWILQLLLDKTSKHWRVKRSFASRFEYGSEEFEIDTVSPFSFVASLFSFEIKFFFGLQLKKSGM
jgi:hypothetical protein